MARRTRRRAQPMSRKELAKLHAETVAGLKPDQLEHVRKTAAQALASMGPAAEMAAFGEGQQAGRLLKLLDEALEAMREDLAEPAASAEGINQRAVYLVNYLVGRTGIAEDQQRALVDRLLGLPAAPAEGSAT